MFKKIFYFEIASILLVILFGFLLHYFFDWTGNNPIASIISPVNESNWEHLKLLFIPVLIFSALEYWIIGRKYESFIPAKAIGVFVGLYAIISFVYTYSGIIGKQVLPVDISIFVISVLITYIISYYIIKNFNLLGAVSKWCSISVFIILIILFIVFTYYPPHLNLFLDPEMQSYGIPK
jgi:hypothetical protein